MAQKQTRCWYASVVHATVDHIGFDVAFYNAEIQKITDNVYKYADFVLIKMFVLDCPKIVRKIAEMHNLNYIF